MLWWLWVILGVCFLVGELFLPTGFVLFFLGLGSLLTALLVGIDLAGPTWTHWLIFAFSSIVLIVYLRKKFLGFDHDGSDRDSLEGKQGLATTPMGPLATGKVDLRGTSWTAKNVGEQAINEGDEVTVVRVSHITLEVQKL